jgi:hypothetical protein
MRTPIGRTIAVLAGTATLAAGGAAYASSDHAAPSHTAKVKSAAMTAEPTSPDTDNIQSGDQTTPDSTANVQSAAAEPTSPDTDNIQSGDQTTPDSTANVQSGTQGGGADSAAGASGEQTGESGSGSEQAGNDGPGGHADEPGNPNADHQFQGQE